MPRKTALLILLLLLVLPGYVPAQGYLAYHQKVAQAEHCIVHDELAMAVRLYDTLFRNYEFCFPKDCYVAAQVAAYIDAGEACRFFLAKGLANGLSPNCIDVNYHLRKWAAEPGHRFSQAMTDSLQAVYLSRINRQASGRLDSLFAADQQAIKQHGHIYTADRQLKPALSPFWDSLYHELKQLIGRDGFPAEKIAGLAAGTGNKISSRNAKAYYILIHHGQPGEDLMLQLRAEIDKGNISPDIYGGIADIGRDFRSREYFSIQTCNAEIKAGNCNRAIAGRLAAIDSNRALVGLPTYQCQEQKEQSRTDYFRWAKSNATVSKPCFDFTYVHFQN